MQGISRVLPNSFNQVNFPMRMPLFALAMTLGIISALRAEDPKPAPNLERIKKDIDFLAGAECEGRGLKTKGLAKAGDYIANAFRESGVKPAFKDGYFQKFVVPGRGKLGTPITLEFHVQDRVYELDFKTDFVATVASGAGKKSTGLVFVGYGITNDELQYDDYAGMDVAGKTVIILRRTPKADDLKPAFAQTGEDSLGTLSSKIENAIAHKAVGVLFVNDRGTAGKTDPLMEADRTRGNYFDGPVFHVKRSQIETLTQAAKKKTLAEIEEAIDANLKPFSFEIKNGKADVDVTVTRDLYPTRNVVGVCEGTGPLAEETVVIGAHYDHLGRGEDGSLAKKDDKENIHFGADDNGSGTAGILELARIYGKMKNRQGRRIVFICFSGEEAGLVGSAQYCKVPAFPLDKTKFMINLDMIGRMVPEEIKRGDGGPKKDRLVVYGTGTTGGLEKLVDAANKDFDMKLLKIPGGTGPSDHSSFYAKKIPVLFLFTGTHKDYHTPTDTPEKINFNGLKKSTEFARVFLDHYATTTEPVAYVKTKGGGEDPTDTTPKVSGGARGPRIGIMPGNYGEVDGGVLVSGVTDGGPAAKAGVKEDDIVVMIAGLPVKNIETYMAAMSGQKPGTEIEVVVLRNKEKVKLKVQLAK